MGIMIAYHRYNSGRDNVCNVHKNVGVQCVQEHIIYTQQNAVSVLSGLQKLCLRVLVSLPLRLRASALPNHCH